MSVFIKCGDQCGHLQSYMFAQVYNIRVADVYLSFNHEKCVSGLTDVHDLYNVDPQSY